MRPVHKDTRVFVYAYTCMCAYVHSYVSFGTRPNWKGGLVNRLGFKGTLHVPTGSCLVCHVMKVVNIKKKINKQSGSSPEL